MPHLFFYAKKWPQKVSNADLNNDSAFRPLVARVSRRKYTSANTLASSQSTRHGIRQINKQKEEESGTKVGNRYDR